MSFPCELSAISEEACGFKRTRQQTLAHPVTRKGTGLFTGEKVTLTLHPAEAGHGIRFRRADLPGQPILSASLENVKETPRCTILGNRDASIQTVEHLLSALCACGIDNLLIDIDGPEVPIFDGSAKVFVEMLEEGGIQLQQEKRGPVKITSPLYWSSGDIHLVALPSEEFRVSYTLHYPQSPLLKSQFYSLVVQENRYKNEIAPCRTFSLYEEIAPMLDKGLIKGGSLENGVIIKGDAVLNPEGVRFPDEMVRHKVLDLIGDLSLVSIPFLAHIIAICSGHASNIAFAREIYKFVKRENSR